MILNMQTLAGRFASFAVVGFVAAALVAGVGVCIAGRESILAVLAGCGVSWISSCAGAIPLVVAVGDSPQKIANAVLASTAVRFLVVLALVAPLLLGGWFPGKPLAASLIASYLLLLTVDSVMGLRMLREAERGARA